MVQSSNEKNNSRQYLDGQLDENIAVIKKILGNSADLIIRKSRIGRLNHPFALIYITGLINEDLLNKNILKILELNRKHIHSNLFDHVYEEIIAIAEINRSKEMKQVIKTLLAGDTVFLLEGESEAALIGTSGMEYRALEEPQSESVIRGSRVGFIENFKINLSLIRQEIKDPNLRVDMMEVGTHSNQKIAICYIDGVVREDLLQEVLRRVKTIDIDFAPDSGFIEQWIEDNLLSPFPQILDTERPDRVAFNILKGKIAIIVEGSPFALLMPITFGDSLKSIEDYNQRWLISSLLRLLRLFSFYMTIFLPALYVALISYHPELIPAQLLFTITAAREGIPFPSLIEALILVFFYEVLQEAGTRLPYKISQTIGIVGGIVIGQLAVMAGIVTPIMVIVISLTAICAFTIPNYSFAIGLRIVRLATIFAAAILGLYGIILVFIMIYVHLANLKSIGVPYTQSFSPGNLWTLENIVVRAPITVLSKRSFQPFLKSNRKKKDGGSVK
mgnify:FL=1